MCTLNKLAKTVKMYVTLLGFFRYIYSTVTAYSTLKNFQFIPFFTKTERTGPERERDGTFQQYDFPKFLGATMHCNYIDDESLPSRALRYLIHRWFWDNFWDFDHLQWGCLVRRYQKRTWQKFPRVSISTQYYNFLYILQDTIDELAGVRRMTYLIQHCVIFEEISVDTSVLVGVSIDEGDKGPRWFHITEQSRSNGKSSFGTFVRFDSLQDVLVQVVLFISSCDSSGTYRIRFEPEFESAEKVMYIWLESNDIS